MESEDKINELIEEYSESIKSVCRKYFLVGGSEEDVYQEGLVGFVQAVKDFDKTKSDSDESFKKFALMCVKRQVLDAIKKANSQKQQPLNTYVSFSGMGTEDAISNTRTIKNPEQVYLDNEEIKEKLDNIKKMLSPYEIKVLDLYLEGKSQSKIGKTLNKSVKSVDNTIQRIKMKIR